MLKRWRGNVYSTSERNYQTFNKIEAKSSFGRHVGGQEYAIQHGGQYKSYYFVEKSKCYKISPLNALASSQISGVRWFLCGLTIFVISKIPTYCLKEPLVTWPLSASGLFDDWVLKKEEYSMWENAFSEKKKKETLLKCNPVSLLISL